MNATALTKPNSLNLSKQLIYPKDYEGRDLRLDFLRGLIMLVVITVHMEYYSFFSLFVWGRIGLVSSAEGFVCLSGIVLGIVYKKRLLKEGFKSIAIKLWKRSFQLYRINLFVILSIAALAVIPFVNVFDVTHWIPVYAKDQIYPLYPSDTATWVEIIQQALLLKIGPHQFQVIGLYIGLIAIAPAIIFGLHRNKTTLIIATSWVLYWLNNELHLRITGARFEWGFPLLTWQLLFVNGMVIGYHHEKVLGHIADNKKSCLKWVAGFISFAFLMLALLNPNPVFWPWEGASLIDSEFSHALYLAWFQKTTLGLGRIVNNAALFIVFYYLLSEYWYPINKALGWLLIPLGQASLYVFILHVYFIILVSNTPLPELQSFWINTAIHASTILLIWLMVKYRVFFQLIPR